MCAQCTGFALCAQPVHRTLCNTIHKTQLQSPDPAAEEPNGIKEKQLQLCFPTKLMEGSKFSELVFVFNQPMGLLVNISKGKHIIKL